jgi:hypothetical protein
MDGTLKDTNQHYITKAYLDRFIHPSSNQAVLYPYRKGGGPQKPRGTKRLGSAANFYRQWENDALNDNLDEARKFSETLFFSSGKRNSSPLSQCVFDDNYVSDAEGRLHLAGAAAFLFCGSPVQIHNVAMHSLLLSQMSLFNWHKTEEARRSFRELHGDLGDEKLEESRLAVLKGELFADVGRENWKQLGFTAYQVEEGLIKCLLGMRMSIVDCHPSTFFLTSDNPAVRTHPSPNGKCNDELWFPISHKRAVYWHLSPNLGRRERFGYSRCCALNRRMIKYAYKYIYSPLPSDWVETAARQETFDPLWGHYGTLERVIARSEPAAYSDGRKGEVVDLIAAMRSGERFDVVGV